MLRFCGTLILAGFMALTGLDIASAQEDAGLQMRISQFSGKPVPRFESLRYSTVNGRTGPSLQHSIAWEYERAGLPVMILKESPDWRRVRDPEGDEVWIHARMLSTTLTGMALREVGLHRQSHLTAEQVAVIQPGAIVDIVASEANWFRVRADGISGWVEQRHIWGGLIGPD